MIWLNVRSFLLTAKYIVRDRRTAGPQDSKTARPQDRRTARPQDHIVGVHRVILKYQDEVLLT